MKSKKIKDTHIYFAWDIDYLNLVGKMNEVLYNNGFILNFGFISYGTFCGYSDKAKYYEHLKK